MNESSGERLASLNAQLDTRSLWELLTRNLQNGYVHLGKDHVWRIIVKEVPDSYPSFVNANYMGGKL
jgi:hypothetical protein